MNLQTKTQHQQSGFSLIEILVAIALLSSLVLVVSPLLNALRENRRSDQTVNATVLAEKIISQINQAWATDSNYAAACVPNLTVPANATVIVKDENLDGTLAATVNLVTTAACPAPATNPSLLRRIQINVAQTGASNTVIETKVVRPQ